jgi:hypothetical protein
MSVPLGSLAEASALFSSITIWYTSCKAVKTRYLWLILIGKRETDVVLMEKSLPPRLDWSMNKMSNFAAKDFLKLTPKKKDLIELTFRSVKTDSHIVYYVNPRPKNFRLDVSF